MVPAHNADVIGLLHDLAQFVGDQDDGFALLFEAVQDAEEVVGLVGVSTPVGSSRIRISA